MGMVRVVDGVGWGNINGNEMLMSVSVVRVVDGDGESG